MDLRGDVDHEFYLRSFC